MSCTVGIGAERREAAGNRVLGNPKGRSGLGASSPRGWVPGFLSHFSSQQSTLWPFPSDSFLGVCINRNEADCEHGTRFPCADFNNDQKLDLAVANGMTDTVSVMFGQGNGTFTTPPQTTNTNSKGPTALINVDLNGDGFPDLITANQAATNLSVMRGSATGAFAAGTLYTVGNSPRFLVSGDLNGDAQPDLISSNAQSGNISVLISQCN